MQKRVRGVVFVVATLCMLASAYGFDGRATTLADLISDRGGTSVPPVMILLGYDFSGAAGSVVTNAANITGGDWTSGSGFAVGFVMSEGDTTGKDVDGHSVFSTAKGAMYTSIGLGVTGDNNSLQTAINNNDYFSVTVTPDSGFEMNLTSLTFLTRIAHASRSANLWAVTSSIGGHTAAASLGNGQITGTDSNTYTDKVAIDLSGAEFQGIASATEFRIYAYGAGSNASSSLTAYDNIVLNGIVSPELTAADRPVIECFSVAHTAVEGQGRVGWSVSNATAVALFDALGQAVEGVSNLVGSVAISYSPNETFTLIAENSGIQRSLTRKVPEFFLPVTSGNLAITTGTAAGVGPSAPIYRRDPSDVIKVGDTWHVWYSRMIGTTAGYDASVWHATSTDEGHRWTEQCEALPRGTGEDWDLTSVFTPNILFHNNIYYLYYTGVGPGFKQNYTEEGKTRVGVATSSTPFGPWEKSPNNPIMSPSADHDKFDSFRIDDSCLAVRGGKIWLYYKGRQWGLGPSETKMGVAVASTPEGPFVRQNNGDPVQLGGHEVMIWVDANEGVYSVVNGVGPVELQFTLQYAPDGLAFSYVTDITGESVSAAGLYRRELTDPSAAGKVPRWGISGTASLGRIELDLPVPDVTFSFSDVSGVGPESGIYRRDPSDVIKVGDTWHLWYSKPAGAANGASTIWHATSTNAGVDWIEEGMAIPRGTNTWDSDSAFTPNILLHEGIYYLYYTGVGPNYWTTSGYVEDQKFRIGVASSESPYGPWTKYVGNPVLIPSPDKEKFDSFRVDDSCLAVKDGKIWLYHKGRQWGLTPTQTKMGVVIADNPFGPFVRQNSGDPVQLGGHEVQIWMDEDEGIYSLVSSVGLAELVHTIQYAADGQNFLKYADLLGTVPNAPGLYRPELTDPSAGGMPEWGMRGTASLARFKMDFNDSTSPARIQLDPGSIEEGNRLGDVVGALRVNSKASGGEYSFELLPIESAGSFSLVNDSVVAARVFDRSEGCNQGVFLRSTAAGGGDLLDAYFDISVLTASGMRAWRLGQFGSTVLGQPELESSVWGDLADPDGDLANNLEEFNADTDPQDAGSSLRMISVMPGVSTFNLMWVGGTLAKQYVESSIDLTDPDAWIIEQMILPPTPVTNSWSTALTDDFDTITRFYRIRAKR